MKGKERKEKEKKSNRDEKGSKPLILAAAVVLQVSITSVGLWKSLRITSLLDLLKEC